MVDLSVALTVWWFAKLTECFAVTSSFVLFLWSVFPPAWETRDTAGQKCGVWRRCEHIPLPGSMNTQWTNRDTPQG